MAMNESTLKSVPKTTTEKKMDIFGAVIVCANQIARKVTRANQSDGCVALRSRNESLWHDLGTLRAMMGESLATTEKARVRSIDTQWVAMQAFQSNVCVSVCLLHMYRSNIAVEQSIEQMDELRANAGAPCVAHLWGLTMHFAC